MLTADPRSLNELCVQRDRGTFDTGQFLSASPARDGLSSSPRTHLVPGCRLATPATRQGLHPAGLPQRSAKACTDAKKEAGN